MRRYHFGKIRESDSKDEPIEKHKIKRSKRHLINHEEKNKKKK